MTVLEKFLHILSHPDTAWKPTGVTGRFEGTLEGTSILVNFNSKTMQVGLFDVFPCEETKNVFTDGRRMFIQRRCNARPYVENA